MISNIVESMISHRKANAGTVQFSKSSLTDPHIVKIIDAIAAAGDPALTRQTIEAQIIEKAKPIQEYATISPALYATIAQNIVESELFNILWEQSKLQTNAPRFSKKTFKHLVHAIMGENDELWPLQGFIDKRRLNPNWVYTEVPGQDPSQDNPAYKSVNTAAASPNGDFIFNGVFCQKLLDYAHLKGLKPKGKKYVSNGGDIPDEYAYIEFLIMHEAFHYAHEDFYYQKIIPKAKNKVINWVGDFRSNYLLVKSGYEQLPMGLYSDEINYDRQKSYVDMYNKVIEEFKKMPKDPNSDKEGNAGDDGEPSGAAADALDDQADDHEPGQAEGAKSDLPTDADGKQPSVSDIDKNDERVKKDMEKKKDQAPGERPKPNPTPDGKSTAGTPGKGRDPAKGTEVDYSKISPTFSWAVLAKRFLMTAPKHTEETYTKPARRGVSGLETMRQIGAAAVKPAEVPREQNDAKLLFCFDSSGSMSNVIGKIFANAVNLLKQPAYRNSEVLVLKYSGSYTIFRANFAQNKAAQVPDVKTKPKRYDMKATQIFSEHIGGGTDLSAAIASHLITALQAQWNVMFFIDADNISGENLNNLVAVIKAKPTQVFVIFDARETYIQFRQRFGGTTPNISYFA